MRLDTRPVAERLRPTPRKPRPHGFEGEASLRQVSTWRKGQSGGFSSGDGLGGVYGFGGAS